MEQMTFNDMFCGITEDEIKFCLGRSSNVFSSSKERIAEFFSKVTDLKQRADMLRDEYGIGGHNCAFPDYDGSGWFEYNGSGIWMTKGEEVKKMKWTEVASRIDEMMRNGEY